MHIVFRRLRSASLLLIAITFVLSAGCAHAPAKGAKGRGEVPAAGQPRWWKGNIHTHSLWSDGDQYPEMVADWYKQHGYQFLALTDHNTLTEGTKWIEVNKASGGTKSLDACRRRFGPDWIEAREENGKTKVRLKTLKEIQSALEQAERFCLIPGEEISARFEDDPVHLNVINARDVIKPQKGKTMVETIQKNVDAVLSQRTATSRPMLVQLNHPNFGRKMTAEAIAGVRGLRFFEVYNGHPDVRNAGDDLYAATDRIWDIVLTLRLGRPDGEVIYGTATDDAHDFLTSGIKDAGPGRGWIVVRAARLSPEAIVAAMEAGEFYASTGVRISSVQFDGKRVRLTIDGEPGVTYTTQFIGTCRGYDPTSEVVVAKDRQGKPIEITRRYSKDVGKVLAEVKGTEPSYKLKGDELYVRAKVISSKKKEPAQTVSETEAAWIQPVVPKKG
jgi:hypothetical protein